MLTILIKAQRQKDTQQRGKELSTWVNKDAYSEWPMYLLVLLERSVHVGPEQQFLPGCHIHEKLSEDHFQLNPSSRMRNSLAEDVLDRKMLILMKVNLFLYCTLKRFIFKSSDKFTVTSQSDLLFILYVTFAGNLQKYLFRPTKIISRLWVI